MKYAPNCGTLEGNPIIFTSFQVCLANRRAAASQCEHSGSKKYKKIFPSCSETGLPATEIFSGAIVPDCRALSMPNATAAHNVTPPKIIHAHFKFTPGFE